MNSLSLTGKLWSPARVTGGIEELQAARGMAEETNTLVPPSIFPDMQRAVDRINHAIQQGQRIGIFGDYDCDGITAVAQLVRYCKRHNVTPWVRLPHRVRDGYGLKSHIVTEAIDAGVTLLITADTGITAIDEIRTLQEQGIDVIVTDHHHATQELPLAYAIVHPALSTHPAPHPSGAGVVYKLIHALEDSSWHDMDTDTALAMIGTVADLVELRGDNRTLTKLGLQAFGNITGGPLSQLREHAGKSTRLSATDIAFRIAPRINAAGRMGEPDLALKALLEGGDALACLDLLNEQRQRLTRELCTRVLRNTDDDNLAPIIVSVSEEYPHGIVGLIAGKLTEQYGRPSLVAHKEGEVCTASLRSPASYHIALGLKTCDDLLLNYGGHAQAAGCTFTYKNLDAITKRLSDDIASHVPLEQLVPTLEIDMECEPHQITSAFIAALRSLEPYGQGNPEPVFVFRDVSLKSTRPCGHENLHLTGRIGDTKCVGFNLGTFAGRTERVDVAARVEMNEWNGKVSPQLHIVDMAEATKKARLSAPVTLQETV